LLETSGRWLFEGSGGPFSSSESVGFFTGLGPTRRTTRCLVTQHSCPPSRNTESALAPPKCHFFSRSPRRFDTFFLMLNSLRFLAAPFPSVRNLLVLFFQFDAFCLFLQGLPRRFFFCLVMWTPHLPLPCYALLSIRSLIQPSGKFSLCLLFFFSG